jgi:ribosomal protein S8
MSHLANFISCVKVGIQCHKTSIHYNSGTKFLKNFIKAVYEARLIDRYTFLKIDKAHVITADLRPNILKNVRMISKPGRKIYVSVYQLKSLLYKNTRKTYILSTSTKGVIDGRKAVEDNIGGELLCEFLHI